jgi:hypothetical protein
MKSFVIVLTLAAALAGPARAEAQTLYTCGDGTIRDVQAISEDSETTPAEYVVTVELNGTIYTGSALVDVPWNLDPVQFMADEAVMVCANNKEMVIDRLDGTDYRAKILATSDASTRDGHLSEAADPDQPLSR